MGVFFFPYSPNKNKTTSKGILFYTLEDVVLATLEELVDYVEKQEEPPLFHVVMETMFYSQTQLLVGQAEKKKRKMNHHIMINKRRRTKNKT